MELYKLCRFYDEKIYSSYICFVQLIPFWLKKYTIHSDLYSFHISIVIDHRIRYIYIYTVESRYVKIVLSRFKLSAFQLNLLLIMTDIFISVQLCYIYRFL